MLGLKHYPYLWEILSLQFKETYPVHRSRPRSLRIITEIKGSRDEIADVYNCLYHVDTGFCCSSFLVRIGRIHLLNKEVAYYVLRSFHRDPLSA